MYLGESRNYEPGLQGFSLKKLLKKGEKAAKAVSGVSLIKKVTKPAALKKLGSSITKIGKKATSLVSKFTGGGETTDVPEEIQAAASMPIPSWVWPAGLAGGGLVLYLILSSRRK